MSTSDQHAKDAKRLKAKLRAIAREMRILAAMLRQRGSTPRPNASSKAATPPQPSKASAAHETAVPAQTAARETAIQAAIALGVPAKAARRYAAETPHTDETAIFRHVLERYHQGNP